MDTDGPLTLDIDGVLANFVAGVLDTARRMGVPGEKLLPHWTHWDSWSPIDDTAFEMVWTSIENDPSWWLGLDPYEDAYVEGPVNAYVTSRPIGSPVSKHWLQKHGFPPAPVHTVGPGNSKKEALRACGASLFVDDRPKNARAAGELPDADGVVLARPWNRGARGELPYVETLSELS